MNTEQKIKEGNWFCAIEGLAIADRIYDFYFEEFDKISQGEKVGDYKMSVVQYRLFCDFDGNPIKRNRVKIYNAEYVSPITPKFDRILKKSIKENPKEYVSFVKLSKTSKEVKGYVIVNYALAENDKEEVAQNLNAIREKLHPKFTFMDLVKVAQECQCLINMNKVLDDIADAQPYVSIYLIYKFGDSLGKRILFNDLDFEIKGGKL